MEEASEKRNMLSKLMPKRLLRFRSIRKRWHSIIGEHDYINLIEYHPEDTSVRIFTLDVATASLSKVQVWMPPFDHREGQGALKISNLTSNGGLICLYNQYNFYISNPITQEILPLPSPRYHSDCFSRHCLLVSHPESKEYTLLAFPICDFIYLLYQTFTLGTSKAWSEIGVAPYYRVEPHKLVSVNGSVYWLHYIYTDKKYVIVAFDVADGEGKFRELPLPLRFPDTFFHHALVELSGSLWMVAYRGGVMDIFLCRDRFDSDINGIKNIEIALNHKFDEYCLEPICIQNGKVILKLEEPIQSSKCRSMKFLTTMCILNSDDPQYLSPGPPPRRCRGSSSIGGFVYDIKSKVFTRIDMDIWPSSLLMPSLVSLCHSPSVQNVCSSLSCSVEHEAMGIPNILEEILSRTPLKSISRFRTVCKLWLTIIDGPKFINVRFEHYIKKSPLYIATYSKNKNSIFMLHLGDSANDEVWKLEEFFPRKFMLRISNSSCNGLICLYNRTDVFVCNPMTREILALPSIEDMGHDDDYCLLTFILTTSEYKVVRLCHRYYPESGFIIFTLGVSKSWSSISIAHYPYPSSNFDLVPVNGLLFWFRYNNIVPRKEESIISFDVSDEKFSEIQLPEHAIIIQGGEFPYKINLVELQGRLSLVVCIDHTIEIWMKDQTPASNSWTKEVHFKFGAYTASLRCTPLRIHEGRILFEVCGWQLLYMISYDTESKISFKYLRQIGKSLPHALIVAASLVSLSKIEENKADQSRYS